MEHRKQQQEKNFRLDIVLWWQPPLWLYEEYQKERQPWAPEQQRLFDVCSSFFFFFFFVISRGFVWIVLCASMRPNHRPRQKCWKIKTLSCHICDIIVLPVLAIRFLVVPLFIVHFCWCLKCTCSVLVCFSHGYPFKYLHLMYPFAIFF